MNVKETVTQIKSIPQKTKSSFGNWCVLADAHFDSDRSSWDYPNKSYFFFTKRRAEGFIAEVNCTLNNNRKAVFV